MSYHEISVNLSKTQTQAIAHAVQNNTGVRIKLTNAQLLGNSHKMQVTKTQYNKIEKVKKAGKGTMITLSKKQLKHHQTAGFLPILLGSLVSAVAPWVLNKLFPQQEGSGYTYPADLPVKKVKANKYQQDDNMNASGIWDPAYQAVARSAVARANNDRAKRGLPPVHAPQFDGDFRASGINMPGHGMLIPGGQGIHIPGGHGINIPGGQGMYLPGTRTTSHKSKPKLEAIGGNINSGDIRPANGENTQYHLAGNHTSFLPESYMNVYGQNYKQLPQKNVKRGKGMADAYLNPQSEKFQMLK